MQHNMMTKALRNIIPAAVDLVSLADLACELVAKANAGDTGVVQRLGAVLRALQYLAFATHGHADAQWLSVDTADEAGETGAVIVQTSDKLVSLVDLACELVAKANAGDTGVVQRLGDVLRGLQASANVLLMTAVSAAETFARGEG